MDIQQTFAMNVRKYRKAAHLSQEKLAELSGLHRTYIGGIEQQRINVSLKNIGKIAESLNVDPAVLFLDNETNEGESEKGALVEKPGGTAKISPNDAAVVVWDGDGVTFRPIETAWQDLTIHILVELIERGYTGDDLLEHYNKAAEEIARFLEE